MADFQFTKEERDLIDTLLKQFHADVKFWQPGMNAERAKTTNEHNLKLRRSFTESLEAIINEGWQQDAGNQD